MSTFSLYTLEDDAQYSATPRHVCYHAKYSWPLVLKAMANDFVDWPTAQELWLIYGSGYGAGYDEVRLWKRQ